MSERRPPQEGEREGKEAGVEPRPRRSERPLAWYGNRGSGVGGGEAARVFGLRRRGEEVKTHRRGYSGVTGEFRTRKTPPIVRLGFDPLGTHVLNRIPRRS